MQMKGDYPLVLLFILKEKTLLCLIMILLANCLTPILTVTTSNTGIARGIVSDSTLRSCLNFHTPFEVSHRTCKQVLLVSVLSLLTGLSHLIFLGVPPHLQPVEGGGFVKGEKRNS